MRKISLLTLAIALLGYLLPFVAVSCQGQQVAKFTGFDLAFGTTIQEPQMFGPPKPKKIDAEPLATLALLCCAAAIIIRFIKSYVATLVSSLLSAISFLTLMFLKSRLDDTVLRRSSGAFQISYEIGFWLSALLSLGTAILLVPWDRERLRVLALHTLQPEDSTRIETGKASE